MAKLTEEEYVEMVEDTAHHIVDKYEDEVRDFMETGIEPGEDIDDKLLRDYMDKAAFYPDHAGNGFGLKHNTDYEYLGSIVGNYQGGYIRPSFREFVEIESEGRREKGPAFPTEAVQYAAHYCLAADISDRVRDLFDEMRVSMAVEMKRNGEEVKGHLNYQLRREVNEQLED